MSKTIAQTTIKNWRWWVALPLILVILPVVLLISGVIKIYEWFHFNISNPLVGFLQRVDRSGFLKPLIKWTHGGN